MNSRACEKRMVVTNSIPQELDKKRAFIFLAHDSTQLINIVYTFVH